MKAGEKTKPHRCQHGLEDMKVIAARSARHDGLPPGALAEQPKTPRGGTGTSLNKFMMSLHPQHGCILSKIKPLKNKNRKALTQTEHSDPEEEEVEVMDLDGEASSQMQDAKELSSDEAAQKQANFQYCMMELEELEQQALRAAGMDVAPEEEDMFCELAM